MVRFCGQDRCVIDANGRLRLPPRQAADFAQVGSAVMLHVLPEGALGVYPAALWEDLNGVDEAAVRRALGDIVTRRLLRRLGAWTQPETLSNQGRLTIPHAFRGVLGLVPGSEAVVTGCGIGLEIWSAAHWAAESSLLFEHEEERNRVLMEAALRQPGARGPGSGRGPGDTEGTV
ncbi:MAG: hypothetical protein JXR77_03635 [Lentisphaeria bacterium]|nr:hypothetical protein [Lentisphaeria bacterium]